MAQLKDTVIFGDLEVLGKLKVNEFDLINFSGAINAPGGITTTTITAEMITANETVLSNASFSGNNRFYDNIVMDTEETVITANRFEISVDSKNVGGSFKIDADNVEIDNESVEFTVEDGVIVNDPSTNEEVAVIGGYALDTTKKGSNFKNLCSNGFEVFTKENLQFAYDSTTSTLIIITE